MSVDFGTESWTISAEDLDIEMRDAARHLAQLTAYRDRLEVLEKKDATHVDNLIKIARELSSVQSEIDSAKTNTAALSHKVDTESVDVTYQSRPQPMGAFKRSWNRCSQLVSETLADVFVFALRALIWSPLVLLGLLFLHIVIRYRWLAPRGSSDVGRED